LKWKGGKKIKGKGRRNAADFGHPGGTKNPGTPGNEKGPALDWKKKIGSDGKKYEAGRGKRVVTRDLFKNWILRGGDQKGRWVVWKPFPARKEEGLHLKVGLIICKGGGGKGIINQSALRNCQYGGGRATLQVLEEGNWGEEGMLFEF